MYEVWEEKDASQEEEEHEEDEVQDESEQAERLASIPASVFWAASHALRFAVFTGVIGSSCGLAREER